ncbi:MAG: Ig-like domain-containing protein, partial [Bacteroidia bacterium]|nr:Ig-like domain-containing protein [Bacteroidia bacterium]
MKLTRVLPIIAMLVIVFIAGCKKDDDPGIRPTVISTDPITSGTNRAINSNISATFSVAMDPASISNSTFTLQKAGASVAGTTTYTGTTASFRPTADLSPNTVYTAMISKDAKNMDGRGMSKDYIWTFTTSAKSDLILPTVTLTDPLNSAVGVALSKVVKVTFSEAMDAATITSFTVAVRQGTTSVLGVVTYAGTVATFTPAANLLPGKVYTVTVTTGAKDMAGNALAVNSTTTFTTG